MPSARLTGALPFNGYDIPEILNNTMQGKYSYPESADISSNGKDIIDKFLRNDPKERITLK
jgi:protein kinase